jgi:DNA-binding transcriptional MerR regulator
MMTDKPFMQIGEIAEQTGLTQRTLRFYEERGLLQPATRLDGGFRLYTEDDLRRVKRIAQFRNVLKLSIPETKRMIEAEEAIEEISQQAKQESDAEAKRQQLLQAVDLLEREEQMLNEKIEQLQILGAEWRGKLDRYRQRIALLNEEAKVPAGQAGA